MSGENRALITATLMIGTLAAVMGASSVNTALPDIMSGLSIAPDQVSWVATSYMLANVIAIPSAAWLGQILSKRLLFALGVAVFSVASIFCGLSNSFETLIFWRAVQGLGGGVVIPTAQSMLFEAYPPNRRGMAMGIFGMGAIMGPAIGPTLGGYMVSLFSWRAVFFINIPFGMLCLLLTNNLPRAERQNVPFDAPGFLSMATFLCCLQIAVTNGNRDGWDTPYILACLVSSAVAFVYMLYRELTTPKPLLDLKVFTYPLYNGTTFVSIILGVGLFGSTFLMPLYLGSLLGHNALEIGLILLPGSLVMGVAMLVSGRLSDSMDSRILLVIGLVLFAYGLHMQVLADVNSPESVYVWGQIWRGLGLALCFSPLAALSLRGLPPEMIAQANGLFNLTRQLAGSIGIAALNTMLTARITFHNAVIGQSMSLADPTTQQTLQGAKAMLIARGMTPTQADLGAFSVLGSAVRQQVMVHSYADLFYVCMVMVLIGIIPVYFLQGKPLPTPANVPPKPPPNPVPATALAPSSAR